MRKLVWIVLSGLVVLSLGTVAVYGQPHFFRGHRGMMMGEGPGMMFPMLFWKVDPNPDQQARMREIMTAHRAAFQTLFEQLHTAQEGVADKLFAPGEVKSEDLTSQVEQTSKLQAQLAKEGLNVALEMRNLLTPEQLAKAAKLRERMRALHSEMRSLFEEKE
ncbi:MAG: periplasmic heavy metal sensor [Deltaproteobacteria bacterium]|nr:periplasmic heavy metal sensor [Deltaproteobacteria bacterium]